MSAATGAGKLLSEFPSVSYDDWRKQVEAELKGAPFDQKMFTSTPEGITLRPIYRREDVSGLTHLNSFPGFAPFVRGSTASGIVGKSWDISQELAFSSPTEFNHAARNSISRGLNALNIVLDKATRDGHDPDWAQPEDVGLGGLSVATLGDLDRALDGIDIEQTFLLIRSGASAMPFGALLVALARKRKKTLTGLRGCIEMDPLGVLSHEGKLPQSLEGAYDEMAALTHWCAERAPHLQTICIHSRAWHESGASAVQELAFVLATAVEYLREMNQRGVGVDVVAQRTRFAITVGEQFFMELSKLRALRMLWARAVSVLGGNADSQRLRLHVRTSQWNKTVYDPYNNLLRATVEAFAGVLGGCDSMQVGAFDEVIRQPDDFSRRLARNTQLVLQKECHLEHVLDPAGGSWFVENLTAELANHAWGLFQEVWKLGGMQSALRAGFPQKTIAATASEKLKAVARRRDSIIGVNQYANAKEKPLERPVVDAKAFHKRRVQQVVAHRTSMEEAESEVVLEKLAQVVEAKGGAQFEACVEAVAAGATIGEITRAVRINDSPCQPIVPVCITRAAVAFEQLREAMDRYAGRTGKPAEVFLCNMGPLREHKARADFSSGFFAAGGYDVISPAGFKTAAEAAAAFAGSRAHLVVICSTDDKYPAVVPPLVQELRSKRPDIFIVLAGYPQDQIEAHKSAGVNEFIHIRADAVEILKKCHAQIGIKS
ncbi:MAG TPA: methylmalonyl-CoA mutase family protein [Candidatus Limnocylindrales bacterium]|jgi:methylmalonyl-CoA mutase|nr:methylmalonyl-CoA mutase family protein [Candidatus Limnocylindrales bacterium]